MFRGTCQRDSKEKPLRADPAGEARRRAALLSSWRPLICCAACARLLYGAGYTIRGVQRILREEGVAFVQNVWHAGSVPPPPEADEDVAENEGADRQEPAFRGPDDGPIHEAAAARREPTRRKLQAVLDELVACQSLIDAALAENYADDGMDRSGET